jgi:hypothetical protein
MLARLRPYILLFLALTVVYHANFRPVDSSDSLPGSLIPFALILDHSIHLDRFVPWLRGHVWYTPFVTRKARGHYFSSYPIGGPLLVSPLYLPIAFIGLRDWDTASLVMFARIAEKFAATTVTALSAVLFLLLLKRITSTPWAWCLTLVYALATETWSVSSQALWQHGPGELAIIGCFYCLERWTEDRSRNGWLWLAGACVGASFVIRPTNLALLPAVFVGLLFARASLAQHVRLLAAPLLGGLLIASYNLYVFQQLSGGYATAVLKGSIWPGLLGLYLSPSRGLLIYTPVALFALCAFLPSVAPARRKFSLLVVTSVAFIILESLVISRSVMWWGGYCWGPRLLSELVPPLIILMALGVSWIDRPWPRRAFAVLALYSVLIQAVGVFFYPNGHWDGTPEGVDAKNGRLWNWRDNPIGRTVSGGVYWEPYSIVGAAVTGGLAAAQLRMHELNVNPYEQAAPASDKPDTDKPGKVLRANPGLP